MAGKNDLNPSQAYLIRGDTLAKMQRRDDALWAGDNIQRGPGMLRRGSGSAGFSLAILKQQQRAAIAAASAVRHALQVYDVSAGGAVGLISVVAGSVTDTTNSNTEWDGISGNIIYMMDPVAGNVPFALPLTMPIRQPYLELSSTDTKVYLNATVDSSTGYITAMEIDSGMGVPTSTDTKCCLLLSSVIVTITMGVASVGVADDGASSNLFFAICGGTPIPDGTQYRAGT